jgi:hypothetical protein
LRQPLRLVANIVPAMLPVVETVMLPRWCAL